MQQAHTTRLYQHIMLYSSTYIHTCTCPDSLQYAWTMDESYEARTRTTKKSGIAMQVLDMIHTHRKHGDMDGWEAGISSVAGPLLLCFPLASGPRSRYMVGNKWPIRIYEFVHICAYLSFLLSPSKVRTSRQ